jgi:hypothetical protein
MPKRTVYLEARERTQEVLNMKWALRAAGWAIASTWHESPGSSSLLSADDHWNAAGLERLQHCEALVVLCGNDKATPELAMMAGVALARGVKVIWIGAPVRGLADFRAVQQFNTAEEFRKQILQEMYSQPVLYERLAA